MSGEDQNYTILDITDSRAVLLHVLKTIRDRCVEEVDPVTDPRDQISNYIGLSMDLVNNLISGNKVYSVQVSTLSIEERMMVLKAVKGLYLQNKLPTYDLLFEEVVAIADGNVTTLSDINLFIKEINTLGYVGKETANNLSIILEDPEVRFERYMYHLKLKKIASNSQRQKLVYIDERIISSDHSFKKPMLSNSTTDHFSMEECIFYHAVTTSGFITGIFTNQASEEDYLKWFSEILLSNLKEPQIIVMDTNPLHGSLEHTDVITRYNTKTDMLNWLLENNIPCSNSMSKPALYELISKSKQNYKQYHLDQVIRSHGHEVLRLPRHFYDLSITTQFWDKLARSTETEETNLTELQTTTLKEINSVLPSVWAQYEQSIIDIQTELFDIDTIIEQFSDMYEIKKHLA